MPYRDRQDPPQFIQVGKDLVLRRDTIVSVWVHSHTYNGKSYLAHVKTATEEWHLANKDEIESLVRSLIGGD